MTQHATPAIFRLLWILLLPLFSLACSSEDPASGQGSGDGMGGALGNENGGVLGDEMGDAPVEGAEPPSDLPPGIHHMGEEVVFQTEPFTLEPGEERFICYTQTLEQDVIVGGYENAGNPIVHHVVFAKTIGGEPEGSSECDVLFRFEWEPIFLAGTGSSEIDFPEGVGQVLPAGTRLLSQLHLLNSSTEQVTETATLQLRVSDDPDPRPMAAYAVGNFDVNLPPLQTSTVESVCTVPETVEFVAAFPHMHLLGTSLTFEVGPSLDELTTVFERDPYDFDQQNLEPLDLMLNEGDVTRVTCHYDNPYDETVTFGESTRDEMCFLVGFAADRESQSGCVIGEFPGLGE